MDSPGPSQFYHIELDALIAGGSRQFRWSIWRGRELVVLLPLLITMMSYICAVPGRLQSTFSYYPVHSVDSSAKWGRVGAEGDGGGGESSDTATRGCRLIQLPLPNPCFLCRKAGFRRTYPSGCGVKTCMSGAWHVQALSGYWFTFYR